jgi:hypothetical protein
MQLQPVQLKRSLLMASQGGLEGGEGIGKSESATSLVGEGISSRESSPTSNAENPPTDTPKMKEDEFVNIPREEEPPQVTADGGKPPRPDLLKPRPSPVSRHRSVPSAVSRDGISAVSKLTSDESNMSWEDQDPGLAMPIFGETDDTANPVPPMSPSSIDATPPAKRRARKNWGKVKQTMGIDAASVKEVNPLETEAEATIFRVVERARRANAAKAGNILPHVSDEAAEVFTQDAVATTEQSNHTSKRKKSVDEKNASSRGTSITDTGKSKGHRRVETLDHTLFNLATKMDTLQNGAEGGRERTFTADTGGGRGRFFSEDAGLSERKGNSGDVLAQNAAVLFRRPIARRESMRNVTREEEQPPEPPLSSSPSAVSDGKLMSMSSITNPSIGASKKTDSEESAVLPVDSIMDEDVDIETGVDVKVAPEGDSPPSPDGIKRRRHSKFGKGARRIAQVTNQEVKEDFDTFWKFLQPRRGSIKFYVLVVVCCVIIPLIATSAILFHSGNPDLGREGATWSWFLLFLVRNVITGTLAKATEVIVIDLLTLHYRLTTRIFGTVFSLLLVQSKGEFFLFSHSHYRASTQYGTLFASRLALYRL